MQFRDRRARYIEGLGEHIDPLAWLAREVSYELDLPITISEVIKVVREVQAVELRASNGLRVIVSTLPKSDVMRFDQRLRAGGGGKISGSYILLCVTAIAWKMTGLGRADH